MNNFDLQAFLSKYSEYIPRAVLVAALIILAGGGLFLTPEPVEPAPVTSIATDFFQNLNIEAKAAYVLDARTGEALYAKNPELQLPLASITKLMTSLLAAEELKGASEISISAAAVKEEGDTGLLAGERWDPKDLIQFTLVTSSNDGAAALAAAVSAQGKDFTATVNERVKALGLTQTYFINPTGLDTSEEVGGAYGSAHDISILMGKFLESFPDVLDATRYADIETVSLDAHEHSGSNTNSAIGRIPGLVGSKTGYTDLAGGNLVVAFDASIGRPVIVTVLGSSAEGRFDDVAKLSNAALHTIAQGTGEGTIQQ